jgi:hypothetical protein
VVLRGSGRMKLDDEIVELKEWDAVRVPPGTWRGYEAGPEGLEIIVIGAPNLGEAPRAKTSRASATRCCAQPRSSRTRPRSLRSCSSAFMPFGSGSHAWTPSSAYARPPTPSPGHSAKARRQSSLRASGVSSVGSKTGGTGRGSDGRARSGDPSARFGCSPRRSPCVRRWARGPGSERLVVDVDSFVGEVHGKQGAAFGYIRRRGGYPLLVKRADTGEVLHIRLRKGWRTPRAGCCASRTT